MIPLGPTMYDVHMFCGENPHVYFEMYTFDFLYQPTEYQYALSRLAFWNDKKACASRPYLFSICY